MDSVARYSARARARWMRASGGRALRGCSNGGVPRKAVRLVAGGAGGLEGGLVAWSPGVHAKAWSLLRLAGMVMVREGLWSFDAAGPVIDVEDPMGPGDVVVRPAL